MSQRHEAREDVESGRSLLGGEGKDNVNMAKRVENHDFGEHSLSLEVEGPCARSSPVAEAHGTYHDRGWAFAFKMNAAVTIIAAFSFGSLGLQAISTDVKHGGSGARPLSHPEDDFGWFSGFVVGLGLIALTVGFAMLILHSFIYCGKPVVWTSVAVTFVSWLWMVLKLIRDGENTWAFFTSVCTPIIAYVVYRERARLPFGAATLKVAATAIKSMPGTIFTSLCVIIVQFLWALFSLVAALGSYACVETVEGSDGSMHPAIECVSSGVLGSQKTSGCYCMGEKVSEGACKVSGWGGPLMLLWMVSMFWGLFVMKNIVTCTVSGSVAAWWFTPEDVKPVKGALYRATCHSFGTLCKAALTVNIASFLLSIVEGMLQVVPGASCLFRFALTAVMYPLNYTVTFAGIYGLDFASAFRRVRAVFVRRGATSLANDLIAHLSTSLLLIITLFTFVVVLVLVVGGFLREYIFSFHLITSILFSYIAFVFVIATTVEVILSAVKAVLVCFIQDPEVLKSTRGRELHDELADAWVKIHPADTSRNDAAHPMEPLNTAHAQTQ